MALDSATDQSNGSRTTIDASPLPASDFHTIEVREEPEVEASPLQTMFTPTNSTDGASTLHSTTVVTFNGHPKWAYMFYATDSRQACNAVIMANSIRALGTPVYVDIVALVTTSVSSVVQLQGARTGLKVIFYT